MKQKIFLLILALGFIVSVFGQKATLELTFTAVDNATYVQLDSIIVINQTQGGDTVLYWPDTVLVLPYQGVGITELNRAEEHLQVFQNYPNPVKEQTSITLFIPKKDKVGILITDILGRKVIQTDRILDRGYHSFRYFPGEGEICFFTAYWQGTGSSIKILTPGTGSSRKSLLEYTGSRITEPEHKMLEAVQSFSFNLGDTLLYIGYALRVNYVRGSDVIEDAPKTNESYEFEITEGIPCPGTPIVTYEDQVYNTVLIGSQCWLKENLNIGTMIWGMQEMTNDSILEKYCYENNPGNCDIYGGLYQWAEAVQYLNGATNTTSWNPVPTGHVTGICPPGWHIPTDEEWKQLEGEVDSQYGYPDPEWDGIDYRGYDVGQRLKSQNLWQAGANGGTDLFGFSALPTGGRRWDGVFLSLGIYTGIWSSSEGDSYGAWYRYMEYWSLEVARTYNTKAIGRPVRCLRDE